MYLRAHTGVLAWFVLRIDSSQSDLTLSGPNTPVNADVPAFKALMAITGMMYQHQRAPLPLELLKDVPQLITVLLEKLLEKDVRDHSKPASKGRN